MSTPEVAAAAPIQKYRVSDFGKCLDTLEAIDSSRFQHTPFSIEVDKSSIPYKYRLVAQPGTPPEALLHYLFLFTITSDRNASIVAKMMEDDKGTATTNIKRALQEGIMTEEEAAFTNMVANTSKRHLYPTVDELAVQFGFNSKEPVERILRETRLKRFRTRVYPRTRVSGVECVNLETLECKNRLDFGLRF